MKYSIDDNGLPQLDPEWESWKNPSWLVQRLNKPVGYKNPFGDVSNGVDDANSEVNIQDVVNPDYMGAAEYEWGVFDKCLKVMQKMGTNNEQAFLHKIHNKSVYVVMANGCDLDEVRKIIDYLYFAPSLYQHNKGRLPEISKNDFSTFYKEMSRCMINDYSNIKTHGWLCIDKYFAWFVDRDLAIGFNDYCNNVKAEVTTE